VEFALAMLIVIAGISALYQALHFELDVFNRLLFLRQRAFVKAHEDQDSTPRTQFYASVDFKPLSEVTPVPVPFQSADPDLRFPTKQFVMQHGAKYADPLSLIQNQTTIGLVMLQTAHYYGSRNAFKIPFDAGSIPIPCPLYLSQNLEMSATAYGFVDPQ
jgi:hypothetical protein